MSHRSRNEDGYVRPKQSASPRTIKRWEQRHDYVKPETAGFKKLGSSDVKSDKTDTSFKPMKKVSL